jgi:hypothetical protein
MTSRPRWIWWTVAALSLWVAWITFAYLPLRQRDEREGALRTEWAAKRLDMLARIETAPTVMMQTEALGRQLDSAASRLPQVQSLRDYLDALADRGRVGGIQSVEVTPELASMMALTKSSNQRALMLDTLVIELVATGGLQKIGTWLDQIEVEPGFRHWQLGRWDKGEEPGLVKFSGTAAFVVVVPGTEAS